MTTIEMKEKTRGAKQSEDHSNKNHDETHDYDRISSTSSSASLRQNPGTPEPDTVYENPETPEPETVYTYPPVIPRKKWAGQ